MPSATDSTVPTSVSSARAAVEALDAALQDACDLVGVDLHFYLLIKEGPGWPAFDRLLAGLPVL